MTCVVLVNSGLVYLGIALIPLNCHHDILSVNSALAHFAAYDGHRLKACVEFCGNFKLHI